MRKHRRIHVNTITDIDLALMCCRAWRLGKFNNELVRTRDIEWE